MSLRNRGLKRKRYFDENLADEIEEILDVSAILEIREFDLFWLAWRWWYGEEPTEQQIEPHFVQYMFNLKIPPWVRQFTRMAMALHQSDGLNRAALNIGPLARATQKSVSRGLQYSVALVSAVAILVVLAETAQQMLNLRCVLPPCY